MHEVYHAPKGHWENIYVNNHLTGLGMHLKPPRCPSRCIADTDTLSPLANTTARMTLDGQSIRPLFDARRGGMRTQQGRLGRSDGADNEKYGKQPY